MHYVKLCYIIFIRIFRKLDFRNYWLFHLSLLPFFLPRLYPNLFLTTSPIGQFPTLIPLIPQTFIFLFMTTPSVSMGFSFGALFFNLPSWYFISPWPFYLHGLFLCSISVSSSCKSLLSSFITIFYVHFSFPFPVILCY